MTRRSKDEEFAHVRGGNKRQRYRKDPRVGQGRQARIIAGPAGQTPYNLTVVPVTPNPETRHAHPPPAGSAEYSRHFPRSHSVHPRSPA